jgi:hypothetical protein
MNLLTRGRNLFRSNRKLLGSSRNLFRRNMNLLGRSRNLFRGTREPVVAVQDMIMR